MTMTDDLAVQTCSFSRSPLQCTICQNKAFRTHYGVVACNSCGSFFRRTILLRRNYLCTKKNCHLSGPGPMCKSCRLQSCVRNGMAIDSILIRKLVNAEDRFSDCSLLERTGKAMDAAFVNKLNILSKMSQRMNCKLEMNVYKPSFNRMKMSKASEFETLIIYLRDIGLKEFGLRDIDLAHIAKQSYYKWLFFSGLTATLRNGGHFNQVVHFSECGYLPVSQYDCQEYWKEHRIENVDVAANLDVAQRFHNAHLDRIEYSTLLTLCLMKEAQVLFPNVREIAEHTNEILRQIKQYHDENYRDSTVRFGDMILLLYEINDIEQEFNEFAMLLALCGFERTLPKIIHDYGL
ncbi:Innexin [Aphelenchoides besseyi]|nr:Innexin [Aphelenchoides besseyi]KAI6193341.1 Innexin [Aphelenchoides besseyi]